MVVENEQFIFVVTHVEADGHYLKIWAQTDERIVQSVAAMLMPLQEKFDYYGPSNALSPHNIVPHTRCCARGITNEFSRARILSLRSDGMVLVQFVDYGNITYVPIHNIRLLDGLSEANYLFSVPEAATVFVLGDVMPIGGIWIDEVLKQIRNILIGNKYCGVYKNVNGRKNIKFTMMNKEFGELLISRNMAVYSPSCRSNVQQTMPTISAQPLRTPHQTNNIPQENWRMTAPQNVAPVQKVTKTNSFKAIQLEIGSVHDVQVSYVEEGPCKFSVQLIDSIPYLTAMMDKINSQSHPPLQEPPIAGKVCLGKQKHLNRLCRVVLNSPGDTSCKAYYADYGHHEVLPFSSIFQIPEEFVIPNIFSIRFTLSGIMNWTVSQDMKDYFAGLVHDKALKLRVCKGPMSPLTQYCDLFIQGQNVKDILSENFPNACEFVYEEPKQLQNGTREIVFVSYVESITKFFVQVESDSKLLDQVMERVEQVSRNAPKIIPSQMHPDMPCIALYDGDHKWYRALVLGMVSNDKVRVFYVDYGNEEIVSVNNLRAIPTELVGVLPKQAIKCSLNGYMDKSGLIDKDLTKYFEGLVLEERLSLIVINNLPDIVVVDLFDAGNVPDASKKDIAGMLKALEMSRKQEAVQSDRNTELSFKPLQVKNHNDNFTGNWEKEGNHQGQSFKSNNNFESYETSKSKFYKDNENEQRHDNRFRKGSSDYSSAPQNHRYDREAGKPERFNQNDRFSGPNNDRFNKGGQRANSFENHEFNNPKVGKENQAHKTSVNARLERSFGSDKAGSDKDSDTSSRSGGRRSNRGGRRGADDQRKRDGPQNNRSRIGRWENDERERESYHKNHQVGDVGNNSYKSKSSRDNASSFDKSKSSELESSKISPNKDLTRYLTSTPISKIPPPNITVGAIKNCIIVFYTNPTSFYVQLCPDNEELNSLMDKIFSIYEHGGKVLQASQVKVDLQCVAQYSADEQWYRAVIKSITDNTATVHFVDYGNIETVNFDKIKEIESEFLKLPAQAVHCKLFCPSKSKWTKEESDMLANELDDKLLEADFVTEENGIYNILIKEITSNDTDSGNYINHKFANGADLTKEKETIRNKARINVRGEISDSFNYASPDEKWSENTLDSGTQYEVVMAWFTSPESFYCQLADKQKVFRDMMNEIQITYVKRQPVTESLKVGSSVIAVLPEDGVLYRAEILELNKPRGHIVQYIDYGDRAMVDPRKIYPVEKKFMTLPRQAIFCGLKNIAPATGLNWVNIMEMSKFFNADKFDCIFHESKNNKYLISLKAKGVDVGSALVDNNLAIFSAIATDEMVDNVPEDTTEKPEVPKIDINLLEGQTLDVKVSSVEMVTKFYVQFHTAKTCQDTVDVFMAAKDPQMLGLPGQLAVMQNQAVECALFDVPNSSKANDTFKKTVCGKYVKIFVEKIENNRLMVRLFDVNGNKIKIVDTQNTEKISPVCSMPILSSTHEVIVTWINSSTSLWLQRTSAPALELLNALNEHYSNIDEQIVPKENELYAGFSCTSHRWYRVKVTKLEKSMATVTLIDYGNVEEFPIENIRTLNPKFYSPHQLGIEVSLTVSLTGSKQAQFDILEPLLSDKVLTATFYNVNRKWLVELIENGEKLSGKLSSLDVVKETAKTQFEYPELAEMVVGEKYDVIASHVDTPNQLWLQRCEELDALKEFQNQLQEAASSCLDYDGIPEEKSLCLAMYSLDNLWYRAEVLDADDEITTVRFIDYGNTDVVDNNKGRLKHLSEKWKTVKRYAIKCKLDVLPANAADWSEEACDRILHLATTGNSLQTLIIADKAPMRIDLFQGGQSICKILVEEKLAEYIRSTGELEEEIVDEVERDPRSAYVSYIISVDQFWVQEDKWVSDLEMMEDRLMLASIFPPVTEIKEGLLCIAHFPDDNSYYRATIISHNEEGTKVRYIDYGNSAITQELKTIPEDLAAIPPLSRKCCLAKPDGIHQWPAGITDEFLKFSANGATIFLLDVIQEDETCLVKLTHDSHDVAMTLLESCKTATSADDEGIVIEDTKHIITEERPSPIGEENSSGTELICTISYFGSLSEFWIHDKNHYSHLDVVADKMIGAEDFETVSKIQEGQILVAKFDEDGQWYRSKVLSHSESGTEVLYIDYGNKAIVKSESALRELRVDLAQIPALATCCSIITPENLKNWSKSACEKFIDLSADGATEFRYIIHKNRLSQSEQTVQVSLFYEDRDVVEILLDHDKTVESSSNESVGQESNELKDRNVSGDSAIQSEVEQHQVETNIQLSTDSFDAIIVEETPTTDEICQDRRLSSTENTLQGETVMETCKEIEKADSITVNQILTEKNQILTEITNLEHKISLNEEQKIVADSVSRGISDEDIIFSPDLQSSSFEEKIVAESINKGNVVVMNETSANDVQRENVKVVEVENLGFSEILRPATASITITHDDQIESSCISKVEVPVDLDQSTTTSKISHAEKLVAGTVDAQSLLIEEEETIIVDSKNIPESQE